MNNEKRLFDQRFYLKLAITPFTTHEQQNHLIFKDKFEINNIKQWLMELTRTTFFMSKGHQPEILIIRTNACEYASTTRILHKLNNLIIGKGFYVKYA